MNTHHFGDMIRDYLKAKGNFGMRIEISHEEELLDTGGGLKKAAWFFLGDKSPGDPSLAPFLVHNVDVVSTFDLPAMMRSFIKRKGALATLAVQERETSRYLLFDEQDLLCGRRKGKEGTPEMARAARSTQALAFCGIHVVSPRIFGFMTETGVFSIIDAYLRLAAQGEGDRGRSVRMGQGGGDLNSRGTPESVREAEKDGFLRCRSFRSG